MATRKKSELIRADASMAQARKSSPVLKKLLLEHQSQHRGHGGESVREDHYKGHHIVIKTLYGIKVDGKKFNASLDVSNAGNVDYHGIPNVGFSSAIDLMRCVIDQFPEEFSKKTDPKGTAHRRNNAGHDHASHGHEDDSDETHGTSNKAPKRSRPKKAVQSREPLNADQTKHNN